MTILLKNNAAGTLATGLNVTDTVLTLKPGDGELFPQPDEGDWFPVTVVQSDGQLEVMKAQARSSDNITVVRGQEGTVPLPFSPGDRVELRLTAAVMDHLLTLTAEDIGAYPLSGGEIKGAAQIRGHLDVHGPVMAYDSLLGIQSDSRLQLRLLNGDGTLRGVIYADPAGDGLHVDSGKGKEFILAETGKLHAPDALHAGEAVLATDGNITGKVWDGSLFDYINTAYEAHIPVGIPVPWPLATAPAGWVSCDGRSF
ncbi:MAG: phage tail protein, partial [Morganella morganii]